jgi:hypothetical protein
MLSKAAYGFKTPGIRDLLCWRTKCTNVDAGVENMSVQLSVKTMVCSEYQRLLEESRSALELWNERRAEICQARLIGKEAGDELLLLQAKYARAYTVLQSHAHNCFRCKSVSRIKRYDSENNTTVLADNKLRV